MKKSVITIAILTLFILFATSGNYNPAESAVGSMAPNFTISNADTTLSLQQLRGNYVLITFWDSAEPQSRIANMQYDRTKANYIHIGINSDRSQAILGELCHIDGLDATLQFHTDADSPILTQWKQTREQLHSFLIDPQGTIIALNPSTEALQAL
jgi:peroxiredoxin